MNHYDRIINRIDDLIGKGNELLGTLKRGDFHDYVDDQLFHEWHANCQSFLGRVFGTDSDYYKRYSDRCDIARLTDAQRGLSIMQAAKDELENGFLKSVEALVSADIFTNFLEMAEHLLEQGYKDSAASLIGAVLEDGLYKIGRNNNVNVKKKDDLNTLNNKLADTGIYNRLTQKRVKVWIDTRNKADHGSFDEYDKDVVEEMFKGVRDLLGKYI